MGRDRPVGEGSRADEDAHRAGQPAAVFAASASTQDGDTAADGSRELPNYRTYKRRLFGQQEGRCDGCEFAFPFRNFTIDHIVPHSRGGSNHYENLQLLCAARNSVKGDRTQAYLALSVGIVAEMSACASL